MLQMCLETPRTDVKSRLDGRQIGQSATCAVKSHEGRFAFKRGLITAQLELQRVNGLGSVELAAATVTMSQVMRLRPLRRTRGTKHFTAVSIVVGSG
jgi:hypothetical protein